MASMESEMPQQAFGTRRRGTVGNVKEAATEDQALNMIAKEAEVRLAAKRAARAEARSIRMKEIEREQKEGGEDEGTSEDTDPIKKRSLSRVGALRDRESISSASMDIAVDVSDAVASVTADKQILQLKGMVKESEMKYKKAMVNSAQLDNERQALQYQVEILRDTVEELQENIANTDDELLHKVREFNKLSREHQNTSTELEKCMFLIKERERVLDEHGINVDGTVQEGYNTQMSSAQCSLCTASLNDDLESTDNHRDRGSLLAEIVSLRSELEDLKLTRNSEPSRKGLETLNTEHIELDQSFADVSNEAAVIRDDALHTGLYVNNNEKNDDFEMIDNGSQAGGIRHFEDQSFEQSSSLTSSMMTATSIESSLPVEIGVDSIAKGVTKDDYDIVHVGDSTKTADINVDTYTNVDYLPSASSSSGSLSSSNINVDKYLFDDEETPSNDDSEHYSVFSVNRYFASESPSTVSIETNVQIHEENNELQGSVDTITNVHSDYDTIDTSDVYANEETQLAGEENRDSPYEDVQEEVAGLSRASDGMIVIEESQTPEKHSYNEMYVESSDIASLNERTQVESHVASDTTVLQSYDDSEFTVLPHKQLDATVDVISPIQVPSTESVQEIVSVQNVTIEMSAPDEHFTDLDADLVQKQNEVTSTTPSESRVEAKDSVSSQSTTSSRGEEKDLNVSSNLTMNTAFCADGTADSNKLPSAQNKTIRNDVEELYNLIAGETNKSSVTTDGLSDKSDSNTTVIISGGEGGNSAVAPPVIEVVDTDPTGSTEVTPKAKERKSKKKKKKGEKVSNVNTQETDQSTVMPSDPLLLGFATESEITSHHSDSPTEKHKEKPARPKSDIPKQFLDASADLIGTSSSDVSDLEDGYISDDGKRKSSKRSKKEGCKSQ